MSNEQIKEVFDRTADMGDFFGVPISTVSPLIIDAARDLGFPTWLRGITRLTQLPRYRAGLPKVHVTSMLGMPSRDISMRIEWLCTQGANEWCAIENGLVHATEEDMIHFMLRFA